MKESIEREEEQMKSQIKYIYFPVNDESRSMSEMLHIAHDREQMERIGRMIQEHLAQREAEKSSESKKSIEKLKRVLREVQGHRVSEMQMLRDGLSVWQIINGRVPIELRAAYNACGRLKRNGVRK